MWWDEAQQKWTGHDEPDFVKKTPSYGPPDDARGKETIGDADPFVMQSDGKGWLYVPAVFRTVRCPLITSTKGR